MVRKIKGETRLALSNQGLSGGPELSRPQRTTRERTLGWCRAFAPA